MQLFQLLARFGADALEALALVANHHGLVVVALDHDGGGNAHQALVRLAGSSSNLSMTTVEV
jgi:hypothetical protein